MNSPRLMVAWLLTVLGKKLLSVNALFHVSLSRGILPLKRLAFYLKVLKLGSSMAGLMVRLSVFL